MKKQSGFEKFFPKKSNAAKKEGFKQEKRKWKKEFNEKIDAKKQIARGRFEAQSPKPDQRSPNSFSSSKFKPGEGNAAPVGKRLELRSKETFNGKPKLETRNTKSETGSRKPSPDGPQMPLNKYIAHAGICSRREAADVVKSGKVKVNGQVVTEPGFKVSENDEVKVGIKKIHPVKNLVYILLNKPKDYLTTNDDPQQRKTVLDLVKNATPERVYPVGRLDRNTSGVLLLTNDGDLSQKLTHPSNEIKKLYAVTLDKPLARQHFDEILKGTSLEDGIAHVDSLAYTDTKDHTEVGIELHTGRNRIVRRIFENYGYDVKNLDRVVFAGLTKKNVTRGKWRFLTEREVRDLKYFKRGR